MIRTAKTYFKPDGSYRGTMVLFVPGAGETLHADGVSVVRADGTIFRQEDIYASKPRYVRESLIAVAGEFSGDFRLRGGLVEIIPPAERPVPPKTDAQKIAELEARLSAVERRTP